MRLLLILPLLLSACMPAVIRRERAALANRLTVKDSLLQLTAYYLPKNNWKGETILVLKNVSGQTLSIASPRYWVSAVYLYNAAGVPVSENKVCSWPEIEQKEFRMLHPGEFLSFKRDFPLNWYYSNLPAGKYTIYVSSGGTIRDSTGRYLELEGEIRSALAEVQTEKESP